MKEKSKEHLAKSNKNTGGKMDEVYSTRMSQEQKAKLDEIEAIYTMLTGKKKSFSRDMLNVFNVSNSSEGAITEIELRQDGVYIFLIITYALHHLGGMDREILKDFINSAYYYFDRRNKRSKIITPFVPLGDEAILNFIEQSKDFILTFKKNL